MITVALLNRRAVTMSLGCWWGVRSVLVFETRFHCSPGCMGILGLVHLSALGRGLFVCWLLVLQQAILHAETHPGLVLRINAC